MEAFKEGDHVYFKGRKCRVSVVFRPIGTYECYVVTDLNSGDTARTFRYELCNAGEVDESMADSDDEQLSQICMTEESPQSTRFQTATEEKLESLALKRNEPSTDKQTQWSVRMFKEWLGQNGVGEDFENMAVDDLNNRLRRFYAEARTKDGKPYSKSALVGIRAGINRHLTSPPYERPINIMGDRAFMTSNHVMLGILKEQRREGLDKTRHHEPISDVDLRKLYSSGVLSNNNPKSLIRKVWFEVTFHLGRRGREGLRDLTPDSFVFAEDDVGVEFVEMAYNEADKNHKCLNSKEINKHPRMYASSDDRCPVTSLKLYLQKRNPNCSAFFQRPLQKVSPGPWYANRAMGSNTLGNLMSELSKDAKLSRRYTNHCVRATTATVLSEAGVSVMDVMSVTGHRNEGSVRSYVTKPSVSKRRELSSILHSSTDHTSTSLVPNIRPTQQQNLSEVATENRQLNLNYSLSQARQDISLPQTYGHFGGFYNSTVTINFAAPSQK